MHGVFVRPSWAAGLCDSMLLHSAHSAWTFPHPDRMHYEIINCIPKRHLFGCASLILGGVTVRAEQAK